jgi:DNA-directed RNA polymerase specialized sigma24 family protein
MDDSSFLIEPTEAHVWRLHNRTPGLSQVEIGERLGCDQSTVSRALKRAESTIQKLRRFAELSGGNPDAVDSYLAMVESRHPAVVSSN